MMIYNAYSKHVDEENKHAEEEQARYKQEADDMKASAPKIPDVHSMMPNMNDIKSKYGI